MALGIGGYSIALDTHDANANVNFVSHAHTDHTSGVRSKKPTISSSITRELVELRKGIRINAMELPKGVRMLSAGHMLGSTQLYIESEEHGCSMVYTGDYQMQRSPAAEAVEVEHADIVIMDSTYPFANVEFDAKEDVIRSIQSYVSKRMPSNPILFGAYSMGKAQELIAIMNQSGIEPFVCEKIAKINQIYQGNGIPLSYSTYQTPEELSAESNSFVAIVEMGKMESELVNISRSIGRRPLTAVASGFAKFQRFDTDVQFPLSDHADLKQALEYLEICSPKRVFTCGELSGSMAKNLKAHGYDARPIGSISRASNLLFASVASSAV